MSLPAAFLSDVAQLIPKDRRFDDPLSTLAFGTDASFYRLIPQLVIRVESEDEVVTLLQLAQPPHPSAVAGRAFAGFDFSCSSFLPSTAGRTWRPIDFLDGHALLAGAPVEEESGVLGVRRFQYHNFLVRDLAVCDPVHRRYTLLPAVPGDLKALVRENELFELETFLAPGDDDDDEDPLSFRVMCVAQCTTKLLILVFSSSLGGQGQWHAHTFDQWSGQATSASDVSFIHSHGGLSNRQFVHGCFYWHLHFQNELLVLDVRAMELSAINLPPDRGTNSFALVEAAEGMLGMLTEGYGEDNDSDPFWLTYSILRNNQWHLEKVNPVAGNASCCSAWCRWGIPAHTSDVHHIFRRGGEVWVIFGGRQDVAGQVVR